MLFRICVCNSGLIDFDDQFQNVVTTGDAKVAFTGADAVIMLGAFPRKVGIFEHSFY